MSDFLAILSFSFSVTGPIFVLLGLGVLLRRTGMLTDGFIDAGSKLVFTIALPTLLFTSIAKTRIAESANAGMIAYGLAATLALYIVLEWSAKFVVQPERDRGVVVQGAFRSNFGVVGLAYCVNAYGDAGLAAASLYLGLVTILVNVLAVITLSRSLHRSQGVGRIVRGIATNPLIIGILLALPVSALEIRLPELALRSTQYLADMTLPLALLCTGASLDFRSLRSEIASTALAALGKLVVVPVLLTLGAAAFGFRGIELGILMLMASAPSAAAGYVMVRAMGGNATLAANIIALTTLGSLLTTSLGVMMLRSAGLI
ncbi:AEC family transporter [Thauera sp. SDU_THAU2]|uniref:AEC family transporter n=1 Tax=Thauera sp. SDU_THAU2 TaxID=3136633 RepID=UPI0031201727